MNKREERERKKERKRARERERERESAIDMKNVIIAEYLELKKSKKRRIGKWVLKEIIQKH